jgi:hypothetical protein
MSLEVSSPSSRAISPAVRGAGVLVLVVFGWRCFRRRSSCSGSSHCSRAWRCRGWAVRRGCGTPASCSSRRASLLGYTYAHLLARYLPLRGQVLVHLAMLAIGAAFLPIAMRAGWAPPADGSPVLPLLALLAVTLGWPFFVLSANAPSAAALVLVQRQQARRQPLCALCREQCGQPDGPPRLSVPARTAIHLEPAIGAVVARVLRAHGDDRDRGNISGAHARRPRRRAVRPRTPHPSLAHAPHLDRLCRHSVEPASGRHRLCDDGHRVDPAAVDRAAGALSPHLRADLRRRVRPSRMPG